MCEEPLPNKTNKKEGNNYPPIMLLFFVSHSSRYWPKMISTMGIQILTTTWRSFPTAKMKFDILADDKQAPHICAIILSGYVKVLNVSIFAVVINLYRYLTQA